MVWSGLVTVAQSICAAAKRRTDPTGWLPRELERVVGVLEQDYSIPYGSGRRNSNSDELVEQRWLDLINVYRLDLTEQALLALPVAGDLDQNFALAYGLLQGNDHAEAPSIALALELTDARCCPDRDWPSVRARSWSGRNC